MNPTNSKRTAHQTRRKPPRAGSPGPQEPLPKQANLAKDRRNQSGWGLPLPEGQPHLQGGADARREASV